MDVLKVGIDFIFPVEVAPAQAAGEVCGHAVHSFDMPLHITFPSKVLVTAMELAAYSTGSMSQRTGGGKWEISEFESYLSCEDIGSLFDRGVDLLSSEVMEYLSSSILEFKYECMPVKYGEGDILGKCICKVSPADWNGLEGLGRCSSVFSFWLLLHKSPPVTPSKDVQSMPSVNCKSGVRFSGTRSEGRDISSDGKAGGSTELTLLVLPCVSKDGTGKGSCDTGE
jgi:hypothetical protein